MGRFISKNFPVRPDILIMAFLVIATAGVYWQVKDFEFIEYDDISYVTENPYVQQGLTRDSFIWAFTATHSANWHPLTWLSHMLDIELYGMNPGPHHLTNVLFHIGNTLLLFLLLRRMTGAVWRSGTVAALFALHPLHVESVAWVAERKDVLSTFFWILTLLAYTRYTEKTGIKTYVPVLIWFIMGLLSKPMLVTLPFVLLLLDYWPLGRIGNSPQFSNLRGLLLEKIPLFIFSAISSIITFFVQQGGGAVGSLEVCPLTIRIANALIAYVAYLGKMLYPFNLSYFYPYSFKIPIWQPIAASFFIVFMFLLAIKFAKQHPYFPLGWLWYMGTLVPVIGLVQVGSQSMADRYTYIPLIGIFILMVWGVTALVSGKAYGKTFLCTITPAVLLVLITTTYFQITYWQNGITLFEHALHAVKDNALNRNNLGVALSNKGKLDEAIGHYSRAVQISPDYADAYKNMGVALSKQGKANKAVGHYLEALRIRPNDTEALNLMGVALEKLGKTDEAAQYYSRSLKADPRNARAHNNIATLMANQGRSDDAFLHLTEALRLDPNYEEAHYNMGNILSAQGKIVQAMGHYSRAIELNPDDADNYNNMGSSLLGIGKQEQAAIYFQKALEINPEHTQARNNLKQLEDARKEADQLAAKMREEFGEHPDNPDLYYQVGNLYKQRGFPEEAARQYENAIRLQPDFADATVELAILHAKKGDYEQAASLLKKVTVFQPDNPDAPYYLACIFARQNRKEEAVDWLKKAVANGYDNWDRLKTDENLKNIRTNSYYQEIIRKNGRETEK
jgi:tetratricopeptide (TPR) repeat protein